MKTPEQWCELAVEWGGRRSDHIAIIGKAIKAERERCAKVADDWGHESVARVIAKRIREGHSS